jgi:hypothetical protein
MEPDRSTTAYPDAAEFAAHVASLHGLRRIVDVGGSWNGELRIAYPGLAPVGPGAVAAPPAGSTAGTAAGSGAAILAAGRSAALGGPGGSHSAIGALVDGSPLIVVACDSAEPVVEWLRLRNVAPAFSGRTRIHETDAARSGHLIVVDRVIDRSGTGSAPPPADFRVVAIMATFNEEDIIGPALEKLIDAGVGVYVVDNWSTDRTFEIAQGFAGRGLVGIERFPAAPEDRFVLRALLTRTEALSRTLEADWFIHHDADESRRGPWPGLGLRDALWRVDRAGFNAVDFTVANYRPIDDTFRPGSDFERHFRHFEFGATSDLLLQIKAWKNVGPVDLAGAAGHQARFKGRRVFPYKFLLKHYPIRSQEHGERKIFRERVARWDQRERARGWHVHYDEVRPEQSFLRDPAGLIEDRGAETWATYMPEALTGAGLIHRGYPSWAVAGPWGRVVFRARRGAARSRPVAAFRIVVGKARGAVRKLRAATARGR